MVREEFIAEATGLLGDTNIQELSEHRFVGTAGLSGSRPCVWSTTAMSRSRGRPRRARRGRSHDTPHRGEEQSFWMGFTDDIVVRVAEAGSGSRIDVRSARAMGAAILASTPPASAPTSPLFTRRRSQATNEGGPRVRIRLPPAVSPLRTSFSGGKRGKVRGDDKGRSRR
jgi:uncharacterized protein DUF1499